MEIFVQMWDELDDFLATTIAVGLTFYHRWSLRHAARPPSSSPQSPTPRS